MNNLLFALCISLMITGLHAATWEGMILFKIREVFFSAPGFVRKPLYECMICMSSVWTVVFSLACGHALSWHLAGLILTVAGINTLLDSLLGFLRK